MLIESCCLDQEIYNRSFPKSWWRVHSKFGRSFNIQDETCQHLAVVSTEQSAIVPNGIYLRATDFEQLSAEINVDDCLIIQNQTLRFTNSQLLLSGKTYQTFQSRRTKKIDAAIWADYECCIRRLEKETGYQEGLNAVFASEHRFVSAIDALCADQLSQQRQALHFLIGRGPGLTPSGDDMIIGHLAARLLLDKQNQKLQTYLRTKMTAVEDLTTDVSKHYLLCSLNQRFNQSVLSLQEALVDPNRQLQHAIHTVLKTGHTSGADFLAGFTRTLAYFNKTHGVNEKKIYGTK
ncbi:DUF2877 domain-containing protein [Enterococcus sp. AZ196]|uniref:DUF2877 domain-containing protein n=1 Tax=Enterococcus sp. AZ196 TaxID=2774659 RepID=UPI003D26CE58